MYILGEDNALHLRVVKIQNVGRKMVMLMCNPFNIEVLIKYCSV